MQEQSVELAFHLLLIFNARYIVSAREHFNYSCMINDAPDGIVNSEKDNCPFTIKNKLYLPYILHFQWIYTPTILPLPVKTSYIYPSPVQTSYIYPTR